MLTISKLGTLVVAVLAILILEELATLTMMPLMMTPTAFAQPTQQQQQQPPRAATPPTDTELVDSEKVIIEQIRNILSSSRLEDYRLYENGTAEYTIRQTTALGAPVNNTITVITEHRYTPANGYIFDNTTGDINTPQGKKLVISIFD